MLCITNNSIEHQTFVCTQLNDRTVLFLKMQFVCTQFCLTHRLDPIRCYHSGPEWIWYWWQWRGTPHSPKFQNYWRLTIRLFNVIRQDTLNGGFLLLCRDAVSVFYSLSQQGIFFFLLINTGSGLPTCYFNPGEFFTPVLVGGLSLETEWQQVSSGL